MKFSITSILVVCLAVVNLVLFGIDFGSYVIILLPVDLLFLIVLENTGVDSPSELDFSLVRLGALIWLASAIVAALNAFFLFGFPQNLIWVIVGLLINIFFADRFYKISVQVSKSLDNLSPVVS